MTIRIPPAAQSPALIVALKAAIVALLLLGVVLIVPLAFPLLAMVALVWLPTDGASPLHHTFQPWEYVWQRGGGSSVSDDRQCRNHPC